MKKQEDIDLMYEQQFATVEQLLQMRVVRPTEILNLNRIGKARLIELGWEKCSKETKSLLLEDKHHFVRSCAFCAQKSDK